MNIYCLKYFLFGVVILQTARSIQNPVTDLWPAEKSSLRIHRNGIKIKWWTIARSQSLKFIIPFWEVMQFLKIIRNSFIYPPKYLIMATWSKLCFDWRESNFWMGQRCLGLEGKAKVFCKNEGVCFCCCSWCFQVCNVSVCHPTSKSPTLLTLEAEPFYLLSLSRAQFPDLGTNSALRWASWL